MALETEQESAGALTIPNEPLIDVSQLRKQLQRQFSHLLALADKGWLQSIQACLCISGVFLVEGSKLASMFNQKGVK